MPSSPGSSPSSPTPLRDAIIPAKTALSFGANLEMIKISTVRESNAQGKRLSGLVAVFVGGTNGIGESTAKEFFLRSTAPRAYIVGRNATRGEALVAKLHAINPQGAAYFLQCDISLLRNVDELCADLLRREAKIHCLFLTAGYMTLRGRTETDEGIDRKMCVNYYARVRCMLNLMPALEAAAEAGELSRAITVLAAGSEGEVRLDDLDLQRDFTLHACLAHCVVMTDFMVEELSRRHRGTSFSHSYPGTVKTGIANELSGPVRLAVKVLYAVLTPWILNVQESGERHYFQMTSQCYPAARVQKPQEGDDNDDEDKRGAGIPPPPGLGVFKAMDGTPGGGAYLLDWDGKTCGDEKVLGKYRDLDMGNLVWAHTMEVFGRAEKANARLAKRRASAEAEGSGMRGIPDPVGWRPAS